MKIPYKLKKNKLNVSKYNKFSKAFSLFITIKNTPNLKNKH